MTATKWTEKWLQSLTDINVPSWAFDSAAVRLLCEGGIAAVSQLQPVSMTRQGPDVKAEAQAEKPEPEQAVVPLPPQQSISSQDRVTLKRPLPQELGEHQGVIIKTDEEASLATLVESAEKLRDARSEKNRIKDREIHAKRILARHGLDYNSHFQPAHKGIKGCAGKASHWKLFLNGICGESNIECPKCILLLQKFGVDSFNPPSDLEIQTAMVPAEDPPGIAVPFQASPPHKRARAGRPKRDHTSEFDLLAHLEAKRPGQYRFLSMDEAVSRLPPPKAAAPNAGEAEMAKRPAQCLLCGVYLHFPYATNDIALKLCPSNLAWFLYDFVTCFKGQMRKNETI